jgi:hypothetical protein
MSNPESPAPQQNVTIQVRYDDMTARYANHVLVNTGNEEVYLDFTSGVVSQPGGGVMPIHTRIAMTPSGVVRLAQLLTQTVQKFKVVQMPQQQGDAGGQGAAPAPGGGQ